MKKITHLVVSSFALAALSGCGVSGLFSSGSDSARSSAATFLESGSIILSHQVPKQQTEALAQLESADSERVVPQRAGASPVMAPLIGYFPPTNGFVPADNETWMEISAASQKISLFHGKTLVKEIQGEGDVAIARGDYFLQHKQKHPVWYAPDSYFAKRLLNVPPAGDRLRYRRGALGDFALYPTTSFPIHSAALWTEEVGGLRVSPEDLASLYLELPVGAPIVIK